MPNANWIVDNGKWNYPSLRDERNHKMMVTFILDTMVEKRRLDATITILSRMFFLDKGTAYRYSNEMLERRSKDGVKLNVSTKPWPLEVYLVQSKSFAEVTLAGYVIARIPTKSLNSIKNELTNVVELVSKMHQLYNLNK